MAGIESHLLEDEEGEPLAVPLSYEIIKLFSEGLYQSPHKAIEELVSNSYDAGASTVRILLPRDPDDGGIDDGLVVVDNGSGMDRSGFEDLWKIAESPKADVSTPQNGRLPIGQFGIGKLAAYVLAWRLTHISKSADGYSYTSMDFHVIEDRKLNDDEGPLEISFHSISESQARSLLGEVKGRDSDSWELLFGESSADTWTAAVLSDFRDLFDSLEGGTLRWVLRTGLPIATEFRIAVDGETLESPAKDRAIVAESDVGGAGDERYDVLLDRYPTEVALDPDGNLVIEGINGVITGHATLYQQPLDRVKAGTQYHRSNGFFVQVRERIINLEDELFGIEAQNHSAWSRFVMEVQADGLHEHLLSSREGVKANRPVEILRQYLHLKFNELRAAYERSLQEVLKDLDLEAILRGAPRDLLAEPMIGTLADLLENDGNGSYYIEAPDVEEGGRDEWMAGYSGRASDGPIGSVAYDELGPYGKLAAYDPEQLELLVNTEHPFIAKLKSHSKNEVPVAMVSALELATEVVLREAGLPAADRLRVLELRDRIQRVLAGQQPLNVADCLRELSIANENDTALERAVGRTFTLLGFSYDPGGGNQGGDDGYLKANLGIVSPGVSGDYSIVYDAKTTGKSSVPADKCNLASLEEFRVSRKADYAFFVAHTFAGQDDGSLKLNRDLQAHGGPATLITIDALKDLLSIHLECGITLTRMQSLFSCRSTGDVDLWLKEARAELTRDAVPIERLLECLEGAKSHPLDSPTVDYVRGKFPELDTWGKDRLLAVLKAVQVIVGPEWLGINDGSVILHQTPSAIVERYQGLLAEAQS
ncbi:MAG: ATP-binding protein [Actinomycetota bacterium]